MAEQTSVAPRERVNIRFSPATGNVAEDVELPFKQMVIGGFRTAEDKRTLEDRSPVDIDKASFNSVMKSHGLSLQFSARDVLSGEEDSTIPVSLDFEDLTDFGPERIAEKVPELKKLMELRAALLALKGPLGNVPAFRQSIQRILDSEETRAKLLEELGLELKPTDAA